MSNIKWFKKWLERSDDAHTRLQYKYRIHGPEPDAFMRGFVCHKSAALTRRINRRVNILRKERKIN
jgi:hypothetical protein